METDTNILVIEPDHSVSPQVEGVLNHLGMTSCRTVTPRKSIEELEALNPDLTILSPSLNSETALDCIHKLRILDASMPILTAYREHCPSLSFTAPFEGVHFLSARLNADEVSRCMEDALKYKAEKSSLPNFPPLVGQSDEVKWIRQKIRKVCDKDITVLIVGETGTGKELIARSIHYHSLRSGGPLVKVNCGALPDELLESEVFGFQTGAFTGAYKDKPGRLEMADGGTLFIDEIGDLSLSLQVKFLQVLEDKAFSRLGGTQDKPIDARVVAATNAEIPKMVRAGTFRKDLFYRLNVVKIRAPALRERKRDIPLLTKYFMDKYCFEFKKEPVQTPDKILKLFMRYNWPGNVRELENVVRRAIALRNWEFVFEEFSLENLGQDDAEESRGQSDAARVIWSDDKIKELFRDDHFSLKGISKTYVSEAEQTAILDALRETHWNRKKAARLLRVSYKTLLNRILEFDLGP